MAEMTRGRGSIIDADAMYKAGFGSRSTGRNMANEARTAALQSITKLAYETVGTIAVGAMKSGFQNLQKFRNATDSQTALLNLSIDKMPKGNDALKESIKEVKKRYDKAARKASLGFGKKRSKGRQDMALYRQQLTDMNAFLEVYKTGAESSQGIAKVLSGVAGEDNQAGNKNVNPSATRMELNNTLEQANGLMGLNLIWDIDKGQMMVKRGGEWSKDENGKDIYLPKGENAELLSVKYSDIRFAGAEDNTMETDLKTLRAQLTNDAWNSNAKPWHIVSGMHKENFMGKISSYSDAQFKDFYFGGFAYDYSTNRMDESAPAYVRLKGQYPDQLEADGSFKEGYGPGTQDWEGRLTMLKEQSFVKGSSYRKEAGEDLWKVMESQYTDTQAEWQKENPAKNGNPNNKSPNQFFLGGQYVPGSAVTPDVDILNEDPDNIAPRTSWNRVTFKKVDGEYQIYDPEEGENGAWKPSSKEQIRVNLEFSDKTGYDMSGVGASDGGGGGGVAPEVPSDFDTAFRDDDKKVVAYFKNNPNLYPGMKVEKTKSGDDDNKSDGFRVTMPDGTAKVFQADPLTGDKRKIQATWDWINNNYVNNEFAE